jgi:hypothetical protein
MPDKNARYVCFQNQIAAMAREPATAQKNVPEYEISARRR